MKAVVHDKTQEHKLAFAEVEVPTPRDNEVLVKTSATSVNAADYRSLKLGIKPKSKIYGAAIVGTIESLGSQVKGFNAGDEILADLSDVGFGAFAEYAVVPTSMIVRKPQSVSSNDAACLPIAATTALHALRDTGDLQPGQDVLIVGAAGGVGTFAVQLAKVFGANITAVCGPNNVAQTKALGAHHVIDYSSEDFTRYNKHYDLILAINGNSTLRAYKKLLKPKGTYVMVGGAMSQIIRSLLFGKLMSVGGKKLKFQRSGVNAKDLAFVAQWMAEGKIRAVIEKVYSFDETIDAMAYLTKGHARSKVVIEVDQKKKKK
jgi:NADPH:quinone reductase-like Zn-dependent oxidoreductase